MSVALGLKRVVQFYGRSVDKTIGLIFGISAGVFMGGHLEYESRRTLYFVSMFLAAAISLTRSWALRRPLR